MTRTHPSILVAFQYSLLLAIVSPALTALRASAAESPATQPGTGQVEQLPPVSVFVGRSTLVQMPFPIKRVSVTDPKVADIQVLTPNQVLVAGKTVGTTDLILWGETEQAREAPIVVTVDRAAVRSELLKLLPKSDVDVRVSNDVLIISGKLSRIEEVDTLHKFLEAAQLKYVDMTTLAGVQQVQIKVTVAEASRTAIRALGINAVKGGSGFFGGSTIGPDGGGPLNPLSIGVPANGSINPAPFQFNPGLTVGPASTLFAGFPHANLEFFVQALAENQYLRVLAEPSLVAISGQSASFLAGGEFPIPVVQGGGVGTNVSVTIEYKEFGVRLRFEPTVMGDSRIRLHVAPEVSELSNGPGSVQIQGFSVPALLTRRAETTLELSNGQTFAMAGLISQNTQARSSRVPGLGDLPIIGGLFRSVRYQQGDTELVLLVTASLIEPGSSRENSPLPGSLHVAPNDWELYSLGRIEGRTAGKLSPADAQSLRESGLNRLRGPGAWADYDLSPSESSAQSHGTR
jgi:pilus assembly protein CpaC